MEALARSTMRGKITAVRRPPGTPQRGTTGATIGEFIEANPCKDNYRNLFIASHSCPGKYALLPSPRAIPRRL